MRKGKGSRMEGLFSLGILIGRRENVLFQRGFIHLQPYQSSVEVKYSIEMYLSDRPGADWGFVYLLKYLIQRTFEDLLKDSSGIPKGMRFPFRVKASQALTEQRWEEIDPRPCPLGELRHQGFRISFPKCNW